MFPIKRLITSNILREISLGWIAFLWQCVDNLPIEQDYLQIFELSEVNGFQKIIHIQECPPYRKEYLFSPFFPMVTAKIYIINDETHATMLFAHEY